MRKLNWFHATALLLAVLVATAASANAAKYVFFFIGDGMSLPQIQATEAYLTARNGGLPSKAADLRLETNRLNMTRMPVLGMQTSFSAQLTITDSAAAATALACGVKTANGVIGMDETKTISYQSIAQLATAQSRRIGILTSVSLDHATPAAFFANVPSRKEKALIGRQMAATGYDFIGGGGLAEPESPSHVWDALSSQGYTILNQRQDILALKQQPPKGRVVCINPVLHDGAAMPFALDRQADSLSLAELTEVAIASLLSHKPEHAIVQPMEDAGFFLMVEGGKIDWACHANDAVTAFNETLEFDQAIGVALDFQRAHPTETLIVVTGDHETGGLAIGHSAAGSIVHFERLLGQTTSSHSFGVNQWTAHKARYATGYDWTESDNLAGNQEVLGMLHQKFGLLHETLSKAQQHRLEDAYDQSMSGHSRNSAETNTLIYGSNEPIVVTATRILNELAGIGWTSFAHTALPVPVFASGADSHRFAGFYDNTDIAKQLARAMGIPHPLPVTKE